LHLEKTTETSTAKLHNHCMSIQDHDAYAHKGYMIIFQYLCLIWDHLCQTSAPMGSVPVCCKEVSLQSRSQMVSCEQEWKNTFNHTLFTDTLFTPRREREKITNCHQTHTRPAAEMFSCTNQQIKPHSCTDRNRDHKVSVP